MRRGERLGERDGESRRSWGVRAKLIFLNFQRIGEVVVWLEPELTRECVWHSVITSSA